MGASNKDTPNRNPPGKEGGHRAARGQVRGPEPRAPCAASLAPRSTPRLLLQFGRTEVIDNTLNPDFVRKFIVDYFFEEKQNLRFDL